MRFISDRECSDTFAADINGDGINEIFSVLNRGTATISSGIKPPAIYGPIRGSVTSLMIRSIADTPSLLLMLMATVYLKSSVDTMAKAQACISTVQKI